jgi:cell division protease FtsH
MKNFREVKDMKSLIDFLKNKWVKLCIIMLFAFFIVSKVEAFFPVNEYQEIPYTQFEQMVENKEVQKVSINFNEAKFAFTDTKGNIYLTDNPRSEGFKAYMLKNDIKVVEKSGSNPIWASLFSTVLSLLLWIGVISFLFRGTFKSMTPFQNEAPKRIATSNVKFADIAANNESKQDMINLVSFLKTPKKYIEAGATMPKGVIFYGPPGTGKTLMAKAIAGEAGVPFFSMSGSDFVEMYVGVGAKRVRELFKEAKKNAPCVVFIDEIDAVGGKRGYGNSNSEREQTINALLNEMDGFNGSEGILVIAATNRIEMLDDALVRPGRFDKHIAIELPDLKGRLEILQLHSKNKKFADDVNLEQLAKTTIGFAGSDLKTLLNEATIIAVDNGHDFITNEDIDKAFYQMVMKGHVKKDTENRKEDEVKLVAWHEAGHAVAAKLLTNNSVPKVTIIPSTSGAGGATFITPDKMGLHSKKDIVNDIKINYAGRIAEYLLLGDEEMITTGASSDIKQATKNIRAMIESYGMTDSFGLLNLKDFEYVDSKLIVEEAQKMSKTIYQETLDLLTKNKHLVQAVAEALIEKETIEEEELDQILQLNQIA